LFRHCSKFSIASGALQDAMRHATQLNCSTGQLAAELVGFSK
jgi:hypothetical protein